MRRDQQMAAALKLSVPERIQFVEDLWDSIADQAGDVELTADVKAEIDRRLASRKTRNRQPKSWTDARGRIVKKLTK